MLNIFKTAFDLVTYVFSIGCSATEDNSAFVKESFNTEVVQEFLSVEKTFKFNSTL